MSTRLPIVGPPVDALVTSVAIETGVSARALRLQTLLHLPRFATSDGLVNRQHADGEVRRLAAKITAETAAFAELDSPPSEQLVSPTIFKVAVADPSIARTIEEHFHYIHSFRADAVAYAALTHDRTAALAAVSPLDIEPVAAALPAWIHPGEVAVISRIFAFDWTPRNTITFLLSRVTRAVFDQGTTKLVLTYLNPNLGFTGASYRAANWWLYAREHGTRYAYLDGDYITDRKLKERFGGSSRAAERDGRVEFSHVQLAPLELYAFLANPRSRAQAASQPPLELERPPL